MKKMIFMFVIVGVLGIGAGFVLGIFFFPFIFLNDTIATEQVDRSRSGKLLAVGKFIHADPSDPLHWGKGEVKVHEKLVHLGGDFEVGPGPKYHVYMLMDSPIRKSSDVSRFRLIDLGRLKHFKGSQNYGVPQGIKLTEFSSVVIWCEGFSVLISPADLVFEGS